MHTAPAVRLDGVTKRFGDGPLVLERLELAAAPGDFVSLIGPSGCGKSTLLRLISGLSAASGGTIEVAGRPPGAAREQLAYIFQEATLLPWLTVAGNIEAPLRIKGVPADARRRRCAEALDLVRLRDVADRYPRQLSGGMKMRVSVARALVLEPAVLLCDEPFGALDEITRNHLNEELLELRAAHAWTTFFVTHSVAEAVFLSNRIVVMSANPGRVAAEFAVPAPYPRRPEWRREAAFHELVDRVSQALRRAETGGAA